MGSGPLKVRKLASVLILGVNTMVLSGFFWQVMNIWKDVPHCRSKYLKPCDLLASADGTSTSCKYQCACPDEECTVVLVDHRDEFEQEQGDICEVTYGY